MFAILQEQVMAHKKLSLAVISVWIGLSIFFGLYIYGITALELSGASINRLPSTSGLTYFVNQTIKPPPGFVCTIQSMEVYSRSGDLLKPKDEYIYARLFQDDEPLTLDSGTMPGSVYRYTLRGFETARQQSSSGARYVITANQYFFFDYRDTAIPWSDDYIKAHLEPGRLEITYSCFGLPHKATYTLSQ